MTDKKPKMSNSDSQKEIDSIEKDFDEFKENVDKLTQDRMNLAPVKEVEPQTKMAQQDIDKNNDLYLKPTRAIGTRDKFNEKFRSMYEFLKQYVNITAENREIIGETIHLWTRPIGGMPAEEWKIPVNKPIWVPRYVADRIKNCRYHQLKMEDAQTQSSYNGRFYGSMVVDSVVQRLDANQISTKRNFSMARSHFS